MNNTLIELYEIYIFHLVDKGKNKGTIQGRFVKLSPAFFAIYVRLSNKDCTLAYMIMIIKNYSRNANEVAICLLCG